MLGFAETLRGSESRMGTCTICRHPDREPIERALLTGESLRNIAQRTGTSAAALFRHKRNHLPGTLAQAHLAGEVDRADSLLDDVGARAGRAERLYLVAEGILERGARARDLKTALAAVNTAVDVMREARAYLEVRAEVTGELEQSAPVRQAQIIITRLPASDPPTAEVMEARALTG